MDNQAGTNPKIKAAAVIILSAVEQPDSHIAVVTACVDLTRPSAIGRDFARALRQCTAIALPARAQSPKLYKALELKERHGLSFRKASELVFGSPNKASALCRLASAGLNAGVASEKR